MKKSPPIKYFSVGQAAKELGISRQAVHKACEEGRLKAQKRKVTKTEYQIPYDALRSYSVSDLHQAVGQKK